MLLPGAEKGVGGVIGEKKMGLGNMMAERRGSRPPS